MFMKLGDKKADEMKEENKTIIIGKIYVKDLHIWKVNKKHLYAVTWHNG